MLRDIDVQKAKLLPQLSLGYVNQSIRGWQKVDGVEKFFSASSRFSSVLAGVNIPLFNGAQKSRIAAGKYQYDIAGAEYNETLRQQEATLRQWLLQYRKAGNYLQYFEQQALKQASVLREQGTLQLSSGAISHLEWILLVHQSIQLEADYFSALADWNAVVIELNAYSSF